MKKVRDGGGLESTDPRLYSATQQGIDGPSERVSIRDNYPCSMFFTNLQSTKKPTEKSPPLHASSLFLLLKSP